MTENQSAMEQEERALRAWLRETEKEPLEDMAGFFASRIREYEAHMAPWSRHYQWMARLLPEGTDSLLDIGCGSGLELDGIFARFPKLEVTGVDLSAEMLAMLREKHPDKALRLVCADYFQWEMGENRFDGAVAFQTLHHFPLEKKAALFRKLCRALKPGGFYLECDYIAVSPAIEALCQEVCREKRRREGVDQERFVHFDTPLTLDHELEALRAGGFSQVEVLGFLPGDGHTVMLRAEK